VNEVKGWLGTRLENSLITGHTNVLVPRHVRKIAKSGY